MKVYVLEYETHEDSHVVGLYSSAENAALVGHDTPHVWHRDDDSGEWCCNAHATSDNCSDEFHPHCSYRLSVARVDDGVPIHAATA